MSLPKCAEADGFLEPMCYGGPNGVLTEKPVFHVFAAVFR